MKALARLVDERSILVCCGSGGVGKTTTAAALALGGAMRGRRACVVTVDPARRLADALGIDALTNVPHRIDGPWPGELHAMMLDAKDTFDELVGRYAKDTAQTERILDNRLYRNLVSALSGTQEYMATEKLFELHDSGLFDLVVIDTPPTRSALDFLDAPGRLASFLDNRLFRLLLSPGRAYLKAMSVATQLLLRTIGKIAGSEIVDDTVAFFQAFEGMETGFRERAARVEALLNEETTGFLIVAAPRRDSIEEASFFAEKLTERGRSADLLVVNRVHPDFGPPLERVAANSASDPSFQALVANLGELAEVFRRETSYLADLVARVAPAPVIRVPYLEVDVHDLEGLGVVVRHLLGGRYRWLVAKVLIVSDARTVIDDVLSVVDDGENEIVTLNAGELVRPSVFAQPPDLVITDCQVQNMGGFAICLDLKLEESGGRIPPVPVLILLDRRADVFLARRAGAEGFLVKPINPIRLRRAVEALLGGGNFADDSFMPVTIASSA